MPSKILILVVALSIFYSYHVCGQLPLLRIKGQVVGADQNPLASATIILTDKNGGEILKTVTSNSGRFDTAFHNKNSYILNVTYTGYKSYRSATPANADMDFGIIILTQQATALNDVLLTSKQNLIETDGSSIVYNVAKSIDAAGVSAFEALKKAPGVYVDNETMISLNGKAGPLVLLDGKQTYLSGKELIDLLKSMPSAGIKSIEIITSPTAKYDATGSAGIINIKTNKSQVNGFNGTATTGISYGVSLKQNQDISFNYRRNNLNVYGSYNHFIGNYKYLYGSDRIQTNKSFNSATDDTDKRKKMGMRLGMDYNINKEQTIGILINSNFVFGGGFTRTKTIIGDPASPVVHQVLDADNDYYYQQTNRYNANLNYRYEDAHGRIVNADIDYGYFSKGNANLQSNVYSGNVGVLSSNLYRTLNNIDIKLKAFKFDYASPFLKGTLEAGAKYSEVRADNDSRFYHARTSYDSLDERRSNNFVFREQITSAYVNYKRMLGKWSMQAGLRLENSSSEGASYFRYKGLDSLEHIRRNYANLLPSLSVSWKPHKLHSISLAYLRRIDRPAYQDLNPFVYLLDELSFWQGNPFLQPQLTHRVALQYAYKSSTIIGLAYAHTSQYSTSITDTLESIKIVVVQRNLGLQKNWSLFLTQNATPAKWWNIMFNGTLYHLQNKIAFDQYRNFNLKQLAARLSLQQTFKLPWKLTGEISSVFTSRRLTGANELTREISMMNLGLQRTFLKDKANMRVAWSDIYKGSRATSVQDNYGFYIRSYSYYETRQVRLNFTYKFTNNSVNGPRSRNSALESESGRIK